MTNEDAQAIKHAVAAGIRAAQHMCPHCGTPWTLWQRRGYDKHPCEAWRNDPAPMSDAEREWRKRLDARCLCDQPNAVCQVHKRATGTGHLSNVTEALAAGATVTMHGQGGSGGSK